MLFKTAWNTSKKSLKWEHELERVWLHCAALRSARFRFATFNLVPGWRVIGMTVFCFRVMLYSCKQIGMPITVGGHADGRHLLRDIQGVHSWSFNSCHPEKICDLARRGCGGQKKHAGENNVAAKKSTSRGTVKMLEDSYGGLHIGGCCDLRCLAMRLERSLMELQNQVPEVLLVPMGGNLLLALSLHVGGSVAPLSWSGGGLSLPAY
mmetsp:Transcript_30196/g.89626  ORF Transcript_30196/g.89626 Transcript_30196/m.89626 type:complete len:208 (+) Transcript_30196:570-1193(+)